VSSGYQPWHVAARLLLRQIKERDEHPLAIDNTELAHAIVGIVRLAVRTWVDQVPLRVLLREERVSPSAALDQPHAKSSSSYLRHAIGGGGV